MLINGKLTDRAKRILVWIISICVVFGCCSICVYSCKRSITCTVNAKRNSITIAYNKPNADNGIVKKK